MTADSSAERGAERGAWVALFSGGKDSSWALYRALQAEHPVRRLVTVHPSPNSYMYHVPATDLAPLLAESVGIPLVEVETEDLGADAPVDASAQGDRELAPLVRTLSDLDRSLSGGVTGVVAGAVASAYQTERLQSLSDSLNAELFAPLYGGDPEELGRAMLAAGFEIDIVAVAAAGLDERWLGRRLDVTTLEELVELHDTDGVHVLGEGGEYETLVTDGPHMDRPLEYEAHPVWDGTRGHLDIRDAWLG